MTHENARRVARVVGLSIMFGFGYAAGFLVIYHFGQGTHAEAMIGGMIGGVIMTQKDTV